MLPNTRELYDDKLVFWMIRSPVCEWIRVYPHNAFANCTIHLHLRA